MLKVFLLITKNLAAFLVGGVLSILAFLFLPERSPLAVLTDKDVGLAVIALLPVLMILMVVAGLAGGVFGVLIYNVIHFFRRKKR
ncbi:MAG: hypothetical protein AAB730_02005 [Patescibacteria group bacterium]